jgi:hypothetical protein
MERIHKFQRIETSGDRAGVCPDRETVENAGAKLRDAVADVENSRVPVIGGIVVRRRVTGIEELAAAVRSQHKADLLSLDGEVQCIVVERVLIADHRIGRRDVNGSHV